MSNLPYTVNVRLIAENIIDLLDPDDPCFDVSDLAVDRIADLLGRFLAGETPKTREQRAHEAELASLYRTGWSRRWPSIAVYERAQTELGDNDR